ncbi:MAG: SAM-dependent methyltransferase [Flavobacterium sp.]|uniref:class I SAM-dependent methyltransferase n=1 Tax=Flavobacterium sp. TaxID=239 RepID=UPI0025C6A3DA|nr:class I SAM-dependent methyltransferase [Flavobacterium sp.]MBA4133514.1 SAM-dependent methyltransferase [Flavobacterium sp.]
MDHSILTQVVQDFINQNISANITQLALQKNPFPETNWTLILQQIAAKQKAITKLPSWFKTPNIYYPSKVSVEQTSSEKTARYKSDLISGKNLIDLSGGFGVDDFYFAQRFLNVTHCEIDIDLSKIVQHNFEQMGVSNIECVSGDSEVTLTNLNKSFDWLYIDPSRRNEAKGKVFMLKDCLPNVPEKLDFYYRFTSNLMIKTAPILDITAGLSELQNVKAIHIVALENEVKELLWIIEKDWIGNPKITTINLTKEKTETFSFEWNSVAVAEYSEPKTYLYEPNAAIMKSGGFDWISAQFKLKKLHSHSHLYTSDTLIEFPGRVFAIDQIVPYNKTEMKLLGNQKANITIRNFPDTVENIRKKWKINDGGNCYSFFTTDVNNHKIVLLCSKL